MEREVVSLVGVIQLVDRPLRHVPSIQTMVLLESFGECISQPECQDACAASAEHTLLDLELELVGTVTAVLDKVVGDVLEDRVRPQQILGGNRRTTAEIGVA